MKKKITLLPIALGLLFCSVFTSAYAQAKKAKSNTSATRSVSAVQTASDGNEFVVVTITINKDAFKGPGKVEETFSSDLMASSMKTSGASFSSKDGKATFTWANMSEDREIVVSYSLRPTKATAESQTITGSFTYSNHPYTIESSSFSIKFSGKVTAQGTYKPTQTSQSSGDSGPKNTLEDLYYIIMGEYPGGGSDESYTPAPPVKTSSVKTTSTTTTASVAPAPKKAEAAPAVVQQQPVVKEEPKMAPAPVATTSTPQTTAPAVVATPPAKTAPAPVATPAPSTTQSTGDLVYHIQIAAVGDKSKASEVLKPYGITEEPILEAAGNATRVMIGNYPNLSSAKTRMDALRAKGLTGGFIVPYYKGKRTTLQEAAKHTNQ